MLPGSARGFTLIELLVVVAIIALLISILLPGLQGAREQSRAVVCGQMMRDFGNGLGAYSGENVDCVPSYNTSGSMLLQLKLMWSASPGLLYNPRMPMQPWDWMTPILASQMELPAARAKHFKFLLEKFRCPSNRERAALYNAPSGQQFEKEEPFPAISYLMPAYFAFVGANYDGQVLGYATHPSGSQPYYMRAAPDSWEVKSMDYLPRMERVGPPARKIFVAEGTRYLPASMLLDFDVSMQLGDNDLFGSFTDGGGWWSGSTAYGVRAGTPNWDGTATTQGSPSDGMNLALTYRHRTQAPPTSGSVRSNPGCINAAFYDGHVQRLTDRRSREIDYWYPTGSVVKKHEGMTDVPNDTNPPNQDGWVIP